MAQVTNFPGTVSVTTGLAQSWTNPNNVKVTDGSFATQVPQTYADNSVMSVSNFGFAIPGTATINGVILAILRSYTGGTQGDVADDFVEMLIAGNPAGTDHAAPINWPNTSTTQVYGGVTDLWGNTLTPAIVNDTGFGVRLRLYGLLPSDRIAQIDSIAILIDYSPLVTPSGSYFWQGQVTDN